MPRLAGCTRRAVLAGVLVAGSLLLLSGLAVAIAPSGAGGLAMVALLLATALAGVYYVASSTIWMARGLAGLCRECRGPRVHPWIQAASCRRGEGEVVCYSNVSRSIYRGEGSISEAKPVPGMHCAWALEVEALSEGVYRGVFLVRGGGRVYRVEGVLQVSRIQG